MKKYKTEPTAMKRHYLRCHQFKPPLVTTHTHTLYIIPVAKHKYFYKLSPGRNTNHDATVVPPKD